MDQVKAFGKCIMAMLVSATLMVAPSRAGDVAVNFTSAVNVSNSNSASYCLGYVFQEHQTVTVTALGYYDDPTTGLTHDHDVGIYNYGTTALLGSATVTNSDPLVGSFKFQTVSPFTLVAGQEYVIVGVSNFDYYTVPSLTSGLTVAPPITIVSSAYSASQTTTLSFPTSGTTNPMAYFGPSFEFASVPEPASIVMGVIGLAIVGGFVRHRRHFVRSSGRRAESPGV
jgi:hypothetical protein